MAKVKYEIYTDGSSLNNPHGMGAAAFAIYKDDELLLEYVESFDKVSNNQMEMLAIIKALEVFSAIFVDEFAEKSEDEFKLFVMSDSQYCTKGISYWVSGWKNKNWKTSTGKDVLNRELWERMDTLYQLLNKPRFVWVKAHDADDKNNYVDALATSASQSKINQSLFGSEITPNYVSQNIYSNITFHSFDEFSESKFNSKLEYIKDCITFTDTDSDSNIDNSITDNDMIESEINDTTPITPTNLKDKEYVEIKHFNDKLKEGKIYQLSSELTVANLINELSEYSGDCKVTINYGEISIGEK